MKNSTCCFLGHREIHQNAELRRQIYETVERLITENGVNNFLFGSKSRFNDLCHEIVTEIKEKYPFIKRKYIRAEYPDITDSYRQYLLQYYEETWFPEQLKGAGRAVYVKRNYIMIDESDYCVIYFSPSAVPQGRKSGTKIALNYAEKSKRRIIRIY